MKAIEKDRVRRYETAHALALDVLRHLNDEPVLAGPPSGLYRARKMYRRHRGSFVAAARSRVTMGSSTGSRCSHAGTGCRSPAATSQGRRAR